ncbi:MAG: hypothetical protein ACWA5U_07555 [bacterium]
MEALSRTDFVKTYQDIELNLQDGKIKKALLEAGLTQHDLYQLSRKDGHRLSLVNGRIIEINNAPRDQKINALEAYLFFEDKDRNGTWSSVTTNNPKNPNDKALKQRIHALRSVFDKQKSQINTNNSQQPFQQNQQYNNATYYPPILNKMSLEEANQWFNQNPALHYNRALAKSAYRFNGNQAKQVFNDVSINDELDVVSKLSKIGNEWVRVLTQIETPAQLRPIAFNNDHESHQTDVSRYILPGEWYIGMSHHNPQHRQITRAAVQDPETGIEMLKLNISHIRNYIGIQHDDGTKGIVSIDSPRSYAIERNGGTMNPRDYPSVLWRVVFDKSITLAEQRAYINNIRTWCMLFNKITKFPKGYNGEDNLMTNHYNKVIQFGEHVLYALMGDQVALSHLHHQSQQVYCSESGVHLALNLGLNIPLNEPTISQYYGAKAWNMLTKIIAQSDRFWKNGAYPDYYGYGLDGYTQYSQQNRLVTMELAPHWLQPLKKRLPHKKPKKGGLVFSPWTVADMIEYFVQKAVPRHTEESWEIANAQAELLTWTKPALFASMGFTENNPPPAELMMLFDRLIAKVRQVYDSYDALRQAILPELRQAQYIVAPRAAGEGAFVPPHIVFSINNEAHQLIGLEMVGQLMHEDALEKI